ncbi:MAG TPA: twin-arginine translocation signal domain-containing protein [Acidimicrobiales bacterium]|jgi:hypothetical protein|nr:twin-arginine translocation signal domain-containing protein [Acidimicrobiales bacterium]
MDARLSRRQFLLGAAATAGAVGISACAKGSAVIKVPNGNSGASNLSLLVTSGAVDGASDQSVSVFEAGMPQRVALVLAGANGFLSPAPGTATLQFGADEKHWGADVPVTAHADTGASATTYLVAEHQWATPGTFWLRSTYQGQTADSPVVVINRSQAKIPYAGQKMISTPTPTVSDALGVNPICTRSPMCPFHGQSLDAVMQQHLPIALVFATPALCETATCGPVLDTVVAAAPAFAGKINFVHSEIFVGLSRNDPNTPAVLAYHLQSEPVMFLADATGTVVERIDGLFGKAEVTAALSRLAAA